MLPSIYVLYHGNCYDGFAAAYAAWLKLGGEATYIPVTHGMPVPEIPDGSVVYILDFSYDRQTLIALADRMNHVEVIDHHKTAEEALFGIGEERVNLFATFAMHKSGAMLAWEHWHPYEPVPDIIKYVQDRDLWLFHMPFSREVNEALRGVPFNFGTWHKLDVRDLIDEGRVIVKHTDQMVAMICGQAYETELDGYPCVKVNATAFWSEVGNRLLKLYPNARFAVSWYQNKHGDWIYSLRSRRDFDVSVIARAHGGGGHAQAAGYTENSLLSEFAALETI